MRILHHIALALALASASDAQAQVTAVIEAIRTSGQVPLTIHVHALCSTLGAGNTETAFYEWDFGDSGGEFNELQGWNAAHTYDTTGTKTITLTVTNQNGVSDTETLEINVVAANRTVYYVSPTGNDSNPGTQALPIQTVAKVQTLIAPSTEFRFDRGGAYIVYDTLLIDEHNVVLRTYGSGSMPIFFWANFGSGSIVETAADKTRITITNLEFDSIDDSPVTVEVNAIKLSGSEVTVRHCHFRHVYYAMDADLFDAGLLTCFNTTELIGGYFCWMGGSDNVHLGNTVADVKRQHCFRGADLERVLIAFNDLNCSSSGKSAVWLMFGEYGYVTDNVSHGARMLCGPNNDEPNASEPEERMAHVVFESNHIMGGDIQQDFVVYSGSQDVRIRNNVVEFDGGTIFSIQGANATYNRTTERVRIHHNTGVNFDETYGNFIIVQAGADDCRVANNLYYAPSLNTAFGSAANVTVDDSPSSHQFDYNLWAKPSSGNIVHRANGSDFTVIGWNALSETTGEVHKQFAVGDLDAFFVPTINADISLAANGVHRDFYNTSRPLSGTVTAGAVQD